jgi:hypothetical protein
MLSRIHAVIQRYYPLPDGCYIEDYQEELVIFGNNPCIKIKNRALKHIVEQRKKDNYSEEKILRLFSGLYTILESKEYKIIDTTNTILLLEIVGDRKTGVVLVLEIVVQAEDTYYIKTAFYRAARKINTLLK